MFTGAGKITEMDRQLVSSYFTVKSTDKGRVSIRGFSWYLNVSIIFWEQIATYSGHASLKTLNRMELWFCVYYVLKVGGVFIQQYCQR